MIPPAAHSEQRRASVEVGLPPIGDFTNVVFRYTVYDSHMAEGDFDILVIENEVDLRDVLARILTHEGYAVRTAVNGAEALAILASPSRPRLIVLDLMMPVVNGVAFLDLRQQDAVAREIPVIVLTGSVRPGLFERPDVAAVLSKPPSLKTFLATVRALCPLASEPPPSGAQMLN